MGKYIGAELYKVLHRRTYTLGLLAFLLGGEALLLFLLKTAGFSNATTFNDVLGVLPMTLSMGLYLVPAMVDIVFSDQYKQNTLKNEVSYGLPRGRIYLGKLLSSALVAVALCAVLVGGYLGLSLLLFPAGEGLETSLRTLGLWLAVAFPLWMGGLGLGLFLQFTMKSTAATITYVMIVGFLGSGFLELMEVFLPSLELAADVVQTISLNTPFNLMRTQSPEEVMGYAWTLGMAWLVVSTAAGLVCFQKKEIS